MSLVISLLLFETGIAQVNCSTFLNSSDPFYNDFAFQLTDKPWITTCTEITNTQYELMDKLVDEIVALNGDSTTTDFSYWQKRIQNHEFETGVNLDSFSIIAKGGEGQGSTAYPVMTDLINSLFELYQKYKYIQDGNVFQSVNGVKQKIPIQKSTARLAGERLRNVKRLLVFLKKKYPTYFNCFQTTLALFRRLDYDIYDDGKQKNVSEINLKNFEDLSLNGKPMIISELKNELRDEFERILSGPVLATKTKTSLEDFHPLLTALQKDGLWQRDQPMTCSTANAPNEAGEPLSGACFQSGLEDVLKMDSDPLARGYHFNGSGNRTCHFILAHWQSNGSTIPWLSGRFVNHDQTVKQVICSKLSIEKGQIKIVTDECQEILPQTVDIIEK